MYRGELNKLVLEGYVERFEFNGLRLDLAFRYVLFLFSTQSNR